MENIAEIIVNLLEPYPWALYIFGAIGFLRLVFKPLFSFLQKIVEATSWTEWDNGMLDKIMESKIYQGVAWFVDLVASVKLPKKKDPSQPPQ